ncbi:hypothetical protein QBC46DRAFT_448661 [Diplogelasinospora grovesii]|uniref:BTB domain-containing protein n=1 Tax=Diplogelasinospora grovesii TaxID=303347 RepID=A0AAN6NA03_9PEZI|nr:hypothetical protein QBC46DRAFT_448661 [Diplogelasinospora grovesii]
MEDQPRDEINDTVRQLFRTSAYSDFRITCGGYEFNVHKAVICPRSQFFAKACDGPFKEASTGVVALDGDDPLAVAMMVQYFYLLNYTAVVDNSPLQPFCGSSSQHTDDGERVITRGAKRRRTEVTTIAESTATAESKAFSDVMRTVLLAWPKEMGSLTLHAKVYSLAEKYDIPRLKKLSLLRFERRARSDWMKHNFLQAVQEVYTSTVDTDRPMRDIVVKVISEHPSLLDKEEVQEQIKNLDLCFDLMMGFRKALTARTVEQTPPTCTCTNCRTDRAAQKRPR